MARLLKTDYPLPEFNWMSNSNEPCAHDMAFAELERNSDKLIKSGETEGTIWKTTAGDGYAYYLVKKAAPLTLQHIPYGDAYRAMPAMIRGLRLTDVQAHHRFENLFRK